MSSSEEIMEFSSPAQCVLTDIFQQWKDYCDTRVAKVTKDWRDNLRKTDYAQQKSRKLPPTYRFDDVFNAENDPELNKLLSAVGSLAKHAVGPLVARSVAWMKDVITQPSHIGHREGKKKSNDNVNDVSELRQLVVQYLYGILQLNVLEHYDGDNINPVTCKRLEDMIFEHYVDYEQNPKEMPEVTREREVVNDLFAQLLGKLSIFRSQDINDTFFEEIQPHMTKNKKKELAAQFTKSIAHIHLDITTESGVDMAITWAKNIIPIYNDAKIENLKHSIMQAYGNMANEIIFSEVEGIDYDSLYDVFNTLFVRTFDLATRSKTKHVMDGYPAAVSMLCVLSPRQFFDNFANVLEKLYECLKKKEQKTMALRCINILVRSWLEKYIDEDDNPLNTLKQIWQNILTQPKRKQKLSDEDFAHISDFLVIVAKAQKDWVVGSILLDQLLISETVQFQFLGLHAFNKIADDIEEEGLEGAFEVIMSGEESDDDDSDDEYDSEDEEENDSDDDEAAGSSSSSKKKKKKKKHYVGLSAYLERLTGQFATMWNYWDKVVGVSTIYNTTRPLQETLIKDFQYLGVDVLLELLGGIPRVIPMGYNSSTLYGMLSKYTVHYSPDVRREAYWCLSRIFHNDPKARSLIVHSYADWMMHLPEALDNFVVAGCVENLNQLVIEWMEILESGDEDLSVYDLDEDEKKEREVDDDDDVDRVWRFEMRFRELEIHLIESLCLVLLHSTNTTARGNSLDLLKDLAQLRTLLAGDNQDIRPSLHDVITESGDDIVAKGYSDFSRQMIPSDTLESIPSVLTFEDLALNEHPASQKRWTRCLGELGRVAANVVPDVVEMAWTESCERIMNLGQGPRQTRPDILTEIWRNHMVFAFATAKPDPFDEEKEEEMFNEVFQAQGTLRGKAKDLLNFDTGESTHDLIKYGLQFMDADSEYMRETVTMSVARLPTTVYPILFHELQRYEVEVAVKNPRKKIRDKERKDRLRNEISFIYRIIAENASPDTFTGRNSNLPRRFYDTMLEYFRYLSMPINEYAFEVQPLRYNFCLLVKGLSDVLPDIVHTGVGTSADNDDSDDEDEEDEDDEAIGYFMVEDREKIFNFLKPWCGLLPYSSFIQAEQRRIRDINTKNIRDVREARRARMLFNNAVVAVEHRTVEAMCALLNGQAFNPLGADEESTPEIDWLDHVVTCRDPNVARKGRAGLQALISFNYAFMDMFLEKCYVEDEAINSSYFLAFVEAFTNNDELPVAPAAAINLLLHKAGDRDFEVRKSNQMFYENIMNRYFGDNKVTSAFWAGSTLTDTMQSLQNKLSATLALSVSDLTNDIIQEMVDRLPLTAEIYKVQALSYIVPWMGNLDLDTDNDGEFDPQMERTIQTLLDISVEFGETFYRELAQVWERVAHNSSNVIFLVEHLVDASLDEWTPEFLQTMKKIAVWLARGSPKATTEAIATVLIDSLKFAPLESQFHEEWAHLDDEDQMDDEEMEEGEEDDEDYQGESSVRGGQRNQQHMDEDEDDFIEFVEPIPSMDDFSQTSSFVGPRPLEYVTEDNGVPPDFRFTRTDIALLLGVEIINELAPNDYLDSLHTLMHAAMVKLDDESDLVHEHAKIMLTNILHGAVLRHLDVRDEEESVYVDELVELINFVNSKPNAPLWHSEDPHENERLVLSTSERVLNAISVKNDIRQRWSDEAIYWGNHAADSFLAMRSFQVYRAISGTVTVEQILRTIATLNSCFEDPIAPRMIFAVEVAKSLHKMVENLPSVSEFPQVLWATMAMMKTNNPALFSEAAGLLSVVLTQMDISDASNEAAVRNVQPKAFADFNGILSYAIKGLFASKSMDCTMDLMQQCLASFSNVDLMGDEQSRVLIPLLGMLPKLAVELDNGEISDEAIDMASIASTVTAEHGMENLSRVFASFSENGFNNLEFFYSDLVEPLIDSFKGQDQLIATILCHIIDGSNDDDLITVMLQFLHAAIVRMDMNPEEFDGEGAALFKAVSKYVGTDLFNQALPALHVVSHRSEPVQLLSIDEFDRYEEDLPGLGLVETYLLPVEDENGHVLSVEDIAHDVVTSVLIQSHEQLGIEMEQELEEPEVKASSSGKKKASAKNQDDEEAQEDEDVFDMFAPPSTTASGDSSAAAATNNTASQPEVQEEAQPTQTVAAVQEPQAVEEVEEELELKPKKKKKKPVWQTHTSKNGRTYFYNRKTKKTQWTKPEDYDGPELDEETEAKAKPKKKVEEVEETKPEPVVEETAAAVAVEETAPVEKLSKPKKSPWREVEAKDGRTYFYNKQTRKTQWKKPAEYQEWEDAMAAWQAQEAGETVTTTTTAAVAVEEETPQQEEIAAAAEEETQQEEEQQQEEETQQEEEQQEEETAAAVEEETQEEEAAAEETQEEEQQEEEQEETAEAAEEQEAAVEEETKEEEAQEEEEQQQEEEQKEEEQEQQEEAAEEETSSSSNAAAASTTEEEEVDLDALAPGWKEVKAKDGRTYYYHRATKKTQWKKPTLRQAQEESGVSPQVLKAQEDLRSATKKWRKVSGETSFAFDVDMYDVFPAANNLVKRTIEMFKADYALVCEAMTVDEISRSLNATESMGSGLDGVLAFGSKIPAAKGDVATQISDAMKAQGEEWIESFKQQREEGIVALQAQNEEYNAKKRNLDTAMSDLGLMANQGEAVKQHQEMYIAMCLYECNLELMGLITTNMESLQILVQPVVEFDEADYQDILDSFEEMKEATLQHHSVIAEKEGKANFRTQFGTAKKQGGKKKKKKKKNIE